MRLEWIDDILAVLDSGSLSRAAQRRFLTQSAFTRRIRMIEQNIGATLIDRRRKPVTLMPGVEALEPELRVASARLRRLSNALRLSATQVGGPLTFACQHALTTTLSPRIVSELTSIGEVHVRVRSGNRDDCLMLVLSGEADFAVMYEIPGERAPTLPKAFEVAALGADLLLPVCTPRVLASAGGSETPYVSYPPEVFMGRVLDRTIVPRLPEGVTLVPRAESALTLAILQFTLNDIGVAWLPESLVAEHVVSGRLVRYEALPAQELDIMMIQLPEDKGERIRRAWQHLLSQVPPL